MYISSVLTWAEKAHSERLALLMEYEDPTSISSDEVSKIMSSAENSSSRFSPQAMNHTLDLLRLIENPNAEPELLEQWDATGEPVRFDGAWRLAHQWIASPPSDQSTTHLVPSVLFLLGWPQSKSEAFVAREALLLYLQHHLPRVRWAAALSLGWLRDERAIPVLTRMLTEFLPQEDSVEYGEHDEFPYDVCLDQWRCNELLKVVLHMNLPLFALPLRAALDRMLNLEHRWVSRFGPPLEHIESRRAWPRLNSPGIEMWARYQDSIIFALGRIGAFDALRTVEYPVGLVGVQSWWYIGDEEKLDSEKLQSLPFRPLLWRVHAALGHLLDELPQFPFQPGRAGTLRFTNYLGLSERIMPLLDGAFQLSMEEQLEAMRYYEESMYLMETMDQSRELLKYMHTREVE